MEPIAILGIGCDFPGAAGPDAFFELLRSRTDATTSVPDSRWNAEAWFDPRPGIAGKLNHRRGGFIDGVYDFDARFFGIARREAERMDPQQRKLLEVALGALDDAALDVSALRGSATGVFVGMCYNDFDDLQLSDPRSVDIYTTTGAARSLAAGRISYAFGFEGPSLCVDAACASSLLAVHLACQSLQSGESTLAIAAGANLLLSPEQSLGFSRAGMLSPDGRCQFAAASANGFVRSDGFGAVVLKPLSQARADGDRVYAVILGSATNNDGLSGGLLMTPSEAGQARVVRQALRHAGVAPAQVQYVEAHGTGTPVGDPTELAALRTVFAAEGIRPGTIRIGSVKSNIGHTEGAAGIAGLIKLCLALDRQYLPATLHAERPNPAIHWSEQPFALQTQGEAWPRTERPRIAGISSFGINGTNVHLVVGDADAGGDVQNETDTDSAATPQLCVLSAHSPSALRRLASAQAEQLKDPVALDALAAALGRQRARFSERVAVVVSSPDELRTALESFASGDPAAPVLSGTRTEPSELAFVFPGTGSQWPGMGRDLLETDPVFRSSMEECAAAFSSHTNWSLFDVLRSPWSEGERIEVIQPVLFALQVALARSLQALGVTPDAVVGHSMGEIAAAHVAGALSLTDAARVICERSQLVATQSGRGAMASVNLSEADLTSWLRDTPGVCIAALNSPTSTVVSGDAARVRELVERLQAAGVFCRLVKVDYASHSAHMDALAADLCSALCDLRPTPPRLAFYSTVTACRWTTGSFDAEYWWQNLRQPVRLAQTLVRMHESGIARFVEVSPHPIVLGSIRESLERRTPAASAVGTLHREQPGRRALLESLGALYVSGLDLDVRRLWPRRRNSVRLAPPVFERETLLPPVASAEAMVRRTRSLELLSGASELTPDGNLRFESTLGVDMLPWLGDHRVQGDAVLPASAIVELGREAARALWGTDPVCVETVSIERALSFESGEQRCVRLTLRKQGSERAQFQIQSVSADEKLGASEWQTHARGSLVRGHADPACALEPAHSTSRPERSARELYARLEQRGLEYGPRFRNVTRWSRTANSAQAELALSAELIEESGAHGLHPAVLDAALQVVAAALPSGSELSLPIAIGRALIPAGAELHAGSVWTACARVQSDPARPGRHSGDVTLVDEHGALRARLEGVQIQCVGASVVSWFHELALEPQARPPYASAPGRWLVLCDDSALFNALQRALAQREQAAVRIESETAIAEVLSAAQQPPLRGIVDVLALSDSGTYDAERHVSRAVALLRALNEASGAPAPRLWLATRNLYADAAAAPAVQGAGLAGFGRVAAHEHPSLRCTLVDLACAESPAELADELADELCADGPETQVALSPSGRRVVRLRRSTLAAEQRAAECEPLTLPTSQSIRVETGRVGSLDGLSLVRTPLPPIDAHEVEIAVEAAALNFRDVLLALGTLPSHRSDGTIELGWECAGTVARVGSNVQTVRPGARVIAVTPPMLGTRARAPAPLVFPLPGGLSAAAACALPIAFMTAHYALHGLARIQGGERVLIHAGTGGVGLAAIRFARQAGAVVWASAGTGSKRQYLRDLGIEHVFDSRSARFADEVRVASSGHGVDVVLNCLAGHLLDEGLSILAPYGRFVEIGMRDVLRDRPIGLGDLADNRAFFTLNLADMIVRRPTLAGSVLREALSSLEPGKPAPMPYQEFALADVRDAFACMAQTRHIGKVVVRMDQGAVECEASERLCLTDDGSYLITGGFGGIGLCLAERLVERGARHLALLGRRGAHDAAAARRVDELRKRGVTVIVAECDVAQRDDLARVLRDAHAELPPLRGVFHAAGVLSDGILIDTSPERLRAVFAPKVDGAGHLHELTRHLPLQYFVSFSSAAFLLGSPGQANYAAANGCLSELHAVRQRANLPSTVLHWGPWTDVGLAAGPQRGARLAQLGLSGMAPQRALDALELALVRGLGSVGIFPFDAEAWCDGGGAQPLTFEHLLAATAGSRSGAAAGQGALRPVRERLHELLARVLRVPENKRAELESARSLQDFGVDSLMALELKNGIDVEFGVTVPMMRLVRGISVSELCTLIEARQAERPAPRTDSAPAHAVPEPRIPPAADVAQLSDTEVDSMLRSLLAEQRSG